MNLSYADVNYFLIKRFIHCIKIIMLMASERLEYQANSKLSQF